MKSLLERAHLARRSGKVSRYHQHSLLKQEDVAQHTFGLMNLLMIMTGRQATAKLLMAAMAHDQGEYISGDIPSPIKHGMGEEFRTMLNDLEDAGMYEIHGADWDPLSEWEYLLLKTADNLDGLLKMIEEKRMGNYTVEFIGDKYAEYLEAQLQALGGGPASELVREALNEWHWK